MDEAERKKYVSQLKDVFDSCDTSGTGYLDQEELTELGHKLHLEAQLPLLLQTLLGSKLNVRVNFEEFKEGFVAVLSTGIDLSTSENESSYLEPANPEKVKPKYIRGSKRYGRRSMPEFLDSKMETTGDPEELFFKAEPLAQTLGSGHLRRSTSLESVESLKSDDEVQSHKEPQRETFEALGQQSRCNPSGFDSPRWSSTPWPEATEDHVQAIWEELGVGKNGYLNREELAMVCNNIGLKDLKDQEVESLFRRLDKDGDDKVNRSEFLLGLFHHGPIASTPYEKKYHRSHKQSFDGNRHRTATRSLISSTVGSQLFSVLDDGTGYASSEQIMNMWQEDGVKNSQDILQALYFSVEEKVNLAELTNALENELMTCKNEIHQAALTCYKNEIDHLQGKIQQIYKERDKLKVDLDQAEKRNVQLAKEVDDRHDTMELLNETKIKLLDQGYKEKMIAVKVQMDEAQELFVQQMNVQRAEMEHEIASLQSEEISSREKLNLTVKESQRLQKELTETVEKLVESEKLVDRLRKDLDYMLKDKFGALDNPNMELFGQEERFAEVIMAYEQECRELRDRNDELQSETEGLRSQLHIRRHHCSGGSNKDSLSMRAGDQVIGCALDPDKNPSEDLCANISIETEIAIEHQRRLHLQEVQDLKIQLETKVNYYKQEIELMKNNFEKEKKYVEQSFKVEISELEDERIRRSQEMKQLQKVVNELQVQQQGAEAIQAMMIAKLLGGQETAKTAIQEELSRKQEENPKLQKKDLGKDGEMSAVLEAQIEAKLMLQKHKLEELFEQQRAKQQQAFTEERSEMEQQLLKEKLQLEEELNLQHQRELQQLRYKSEMLAEENSSLKRKVAMFHQDFRDLEGKVNEQRKQVAWLKDERECSQREFKELQSQYTTEISQLSTKNLQLSNQNSQLSVKVDANQSTIQLLNARLAELGQQREEMGKVSRQLQETCGSLEKERFQQQSAWESEKDLMQKELQAFQGKIKSLELSLEQSHSEMDHLKCELQEKQQVNMSLMQELGSIMKSLQESKDKVRQMHRLATELELMKKENQTLQNKQVILEASLTESQDQLLEANTKLMQAQSQHVEEVQELKEQMNNVVPKNQLVQLQMKISESEQRVQQLQEQLETQCQEANNIMREQKEEYKTLRKQMEERIEEAEQKLRNVRLMLQEKMTQLKEQDVIDCAAKMSLQQVPVSLFAWFGLLLRQGLLTSIRIQQCLNVKMFILNFKMIV
ncbi:ninein-like protein isoform X2 [Narcine bancroftii]|uniref:ninein-like protein isoform X2 n=1 Tax=Narcine bancroftii TaxID=1343680 RepID=UPI003831A536